MSLPAEGFDARAASLRKAAIALRGVRVHNLKGIDLDIPLRQLTVVTGVSGSGKSSLAFDTLFAEGQRRFLESASAASRQWVPQLERPDADRIDHIPPAIALRQDNRAASSGRATLATVTEIHDSLRQLFARLGTIVCGKCHRDVRTETPETVLARLRQLAAGTRFQVAFPFNAAAAHNPDELRRAGFTRMVREGRTQELTAWTTETASDAWVIVDRLTAGKPDDSRILDSLGAAFRFGNGACAVLVDESTEETWVADSRTVDIDGRDWRVANFHDDLTCPSCREIYLAPEPRLFSFQSPLGACPRCHGFGVVATVSAENVVANSVSLREAFDDPGMTPHARKVAAEYLAMAAKSGLPVDEPLATWNDDQRMILREGAKKGRRKHVGLVEWLADLESRSHQPGVRSLLRRWRRTEACPECRSLRLRSAALAVRLPADAEGNRLNIAEMSRLTAVEARAFCEHLHASLPDAIRPRIAPVWRALQNRLSLLAELGIDDIELDRPLRALSSGEARRVALAAVLGAPLVHALYVLDEPSAGLHPADAARVLPAIQRLLKSPNTVVVVEHDDEFLRTAEHVVEIGPGAGPEGGRVVFQGPPAEMIASESSPSGAWLSGRNTMPSRSASRPKVGDAGWLRLSDCRIHNLKNVMVDLPLGSLCVVTGVSGAGKSSLVAGSLAPAVRRLLGRPLLDLNADRTATASLHCGNGSQIPETHPRPMDDVVLVDQSPLPRSLRSTPATCLKVFDLIRKQFATTADAQAKNYGPLHFSFNAAGGGRCPKCEGTGVLRIDMQFLADVSMPCPDCRGTRFQREILDVRHRGLNIAETMNLTVREAFSFYARNPKIVKRLQPLRDVGLDYLPLGQPVTTLSGGECRRLKLAMHLAGSRRSRTLFLLDEPTTGLHAADISTLLACFDALLAVGHSLVVIEHHAGLIAAADWEVRLGPGAGRRGGELTHSGPPAIGQPS